METLLRQLVRRLSEEFKPDLLVVTGDLVDVPFYLIDQIRLGQARAELVERMATDYLLVKACLDGASIPYVVLPGNHDYPPALHKAFPDPRISYEFSGLRLASYPFDAEGPNSVPTRNYANYTDQEHGKNAQVHLQHYVITPELNEEYPHTYDNADEILARNAESSSLLSLSGHYHPGAGPAQVKDTTYVVGSAFSDPPHPWYLYDIDLKTGSVQQHRFSMQAHLLDSSRIVPINLADLPDAEVKHADELAVLTTGEMTESRRDQLWEELRKEGYPVSGVYVLSDREAYGATCDFIHTLGEGPTSGLKQ